MPHTRPQPLPLDVALQQAVAHHQAGRLQEAEQLYRAILRAEPNDPDANHNLGLLARQVGQHAASLPYLNAALTANPAHEQFLQSYVDALLATGHPQEAMNALDGVVRQGIENAATRALRQRIESAARGVQQAADANAPGTSHQLQAEISELGKMFNACQFPEMESHARLLIDHYPDVGFLWKGLCVALLSQGKDAVLPAQKAAQLLSGDAECHYNLGNALKDLGRLEEAVAAFQAALEINPRFALAHNNLGLALADLGHWVGASESWQRAVQINPALHDAHNNLGNALKELGDLDGAVASYLRVLALKPDSAEAHCNLGVAQISLRHTEQAIASFSRALALRADLAEAHNNMGIALAELGRAEDAETNIRQALRIRPGYAEAHINLGNVFGNIRRFRDAEQCYRRALELSPGHDYLFGSWLHAKLKICDWDGLDRELARLGDKIERGERASTPFPLLSMLRSRVLHRKASEIWVKANWARDNPRPVVERQPRREKIRIGYFSGDFRDHATAYLIAGLFERHDKSRFELTAFSFGPDTKDATRTRIAAAFDRFCDVRDMPDGDVAALSKRLEIDIATDLSGFTHGSRPGIFSLRAAPIQVNYLGYPGTMAAPFIDYLIADQTLIPAAHRADHTEKIVYLPHCYQANDSKRIISEKRFTRSELDLPQDGFVFCCFNNNYKIMPSTFDGWMRILRKADRSVLWLFEDNETAAANLRREAELRGVVGERLIFARRMALPEHLARHRLADLFLDTLPYNAHTTASDALWAGLPVLTCIGETFAGRVGASLLKAVGLPELISSTPERYEALAIELAGNPDGLSEIKRKLADNRLSTPLFDTRLFTRHIEAAYAAMHARHMANLAPEHIHVQP